MPNKLPLKTRAKAIARERSQAIDWLALWAVSLGVSAVVMAAIAFFSVADRIGAALILAGTAALISVIMKASADGYL